MKKLQKEEIPKLWTTAHVSLFIIVSVAEMIF